MKDYLIFMDVSGDLDPMFVNTDKVGLVSMEMLVGDEPFTIHGNNNEEVVAFYEKIKEGKQGKTSQINPFMFEEKFTPFLEQGYSILYVALSSGLSSTYTSALTASQTLKEKFSDVSFEVIDSLNATGAMGILVENLVINKERGMSLEENKADTEALAKKLYTTAYVDDLMHLKRGGRISSTTAIIGSLIGIKPIIKVNEIGKLDTIGKQKGDLRAVLSVAMKYGETGDHDSSLPVYICHSLNEKMAKVLEDKIKSINPKAIVRTMQLSPIIGAHTGPKSIVCSFKVR